MFMFCLNVSALLRTILAYKFYKLLIFRSCVISEFISSLVDCKLQTLFLGKKVVHILFFVFKFYGYEFGWFIELKWLMVETGTELGIYRSKFFCKK